MTSSIAKANVSALLSLINLSAQQAVAEYERTGHGVPTLDTSHPLDSATDVLELKKAIRILEGACEQLCSTLAQPVHTLGNRAQGTLEPACIRVAAESRVADYLVDHPEGLHVNELSKRTGIESGKLSRVMRLLATRNCFREVAANVFANNRLSVFLISSNPVSAALGHHSDDSKNGAAFLYDALVDPEFGPSYSSTKSAFMYSVRNEGIDGNIFDWFAAHPRKNERFGRAMIGFNSLSASGSVLKDYPWKDMSQGTVICDVGGGIGGFSLPLAKAHPHLKIVLHDLPETIDQAKEYWKTEYPEIANEHRVDFLPLNFFEEQPALADVYYLRQVIHDWSDDEALVILRNVRKAMTATSRLLIQDYVLQHLNLSPEQTEHAATDAPAPLLRNYGSGNIRLYNQDMNMLTMLSAKERMVDEFKALGKRAGLRLMKVWDFVDTNVLEFSPA